MIKDVCQFNQLFQLYQKDDRYNLYIHDFPKNEFVQLFFNDTIEDLFVNFIGAIVFSCFTFFDLKHNRSNSFINRFVPTKGNNKLIKSI